MPFCPHCGRSNPEEARTCSGCANTLPAETLSKAVRQEAGHIAWLLGEIPHWPIRGWVNASSANLLLREYAQRRTELLRPAEPPKPAVSPAPPASVPSVVPPTVERREAPASPRAPQTVPAAPPPREMKIQAPPPAITPPVVRAAEAPGRPWLAEFFEAHWLKLLAVLSAVFIFVGMRQVVQWEWVNTYAILMVPLLPLSLTVAFYLFGMRARTERALGAFAYCAVAIVLAAFSVFSLNKYWPANSLTPSSSVAAGMVTSTLLAAWTLYRTRDIGFLHLLLAGTAASLYAFLQVVHPAPLLAPASGGVYAAAFLGLALLSLATAWRLRRANLNVEFVLPLLMWAHLAATAALARVTLPLLTGQGAQGEATALLAAATVLYGLSAQWFASVRMAHTTGVLANVTAALLVWNSGQTGWYAWGLAALVLSVGALGMSALNHLGAGGNALHRVSIAEAYDRMAVMLGLAAGGTLLGRLAVTLPMNAPSLVTADWGQGVLLGALCAGLYALFAFFRRGTVWLYPASASALFALGLATHCLLPHVPLFAPYTLAHDLLPFTALALLLGLALCRGCAAETDSLRAAWAAPFRHSAALTAAVGLLVAIGGGLVHGPSAGVWSALIPYGLLCAVAAVALLKEADPTPTRGWAVGALGAAMAAAVFAAMADVPRAPWDLPLAAGMALALCACALSLSVILLQRRRPAHPWRIVLQGGLPAGAFLGAIPAATGVNGAFAWMTVVFALAFGALFAAGTAARSLNTLYAAAAILLLAALRLGAIVYVGGESGPPAALALILFALGAGLFYGFAARRFDRSEPAWLFALALGIAGLSGAAFGGSRSTLELTIAGLSALGTMAGAVGLGLAAVRWKTPPFTSVAGLYGLAAYLRLLTLLIPFRANEAGLLVLPAILILLYLAYRRRGENETLYRRPLEAVALGTAGVALAVSCSSALNGGAQTYFPAALALLGYAVLTAAFALIRPTERDPLALGSLWLLVIGGGLILTMPPATSPALLLTTILPATAVLCAGLYARLAWTNGSVTAGYQAGLTLCGAAYVLLDRILPVPDLWRGLAALPFVLFLYGVSHRLRDRLEVSLGGPFRQVAFGVAALCLALTAALGIDKGVPAALPCAATFLIYAVVSLCLALLRSAESEAMAAASVLLLVGGGGFALSETTAGATPVTLLLLAVSSLCVLLYGRYAWLTERPAFGYVAGLTACGVWSVFAVRIPAIEPLWRLSASLPFLIALYAVGQALRKHGETPLGAPLRQTAVGAVVAGAGYTTALAALTGTAAYAPAALALLGSAVALAVAALVRPTEERYRSPLSFLLLAGGACFTLATGPHTPFPLPPAGIFLAAAGHCALLYTRPAWINGSVTAGYQAGLTLCGAAYVLLDRLLPVPDLWLGLAALPFLLLLYEIGYRLRDRQEASLGRPFRQVALGAAVLCLAQTPHFGLQAGAVAALPCAATLLAYAVLFACATLRRPAESSGMAAFSVLLLGGGWGFALQDTVPGFTSTTLLLLAVSGLCSLLYGRHAFLNGQPLFGSAAGLATLGAWFALVVRAFAVPPLLRGLTALPLLAALYALGFRFRAQQEAALGLPLRALALVLSFTGLVTAFLLGLEKPLETSLTVSVTLAAYGLAYLAGTVLWRTVSWMTLTVSVLTLACGYRLGTIGLTPPQWACGMVCAGALWLLIARLLESRSGVAALARPPALTATLLTTLSAGIGIAFVNLPNQGLYTLLALIVAGCVYFGQFLFGRGEGFAHAGVAAYFLAYALFLYDKIHLHVGVLDLYLIPVGLYLVLLGHIAGKRGTEDTAGTLWWLGLLTVLTPTFLAFYAHQMTGDTPFHAFLLLVECVGAIGWGIARRIKAFVFAGALFALAYAAIRAHGAVVEVWSGLFTVLLGVLMLMFVFLMSVHQEAIRRWMQRFGEEWRQWR